MLIIWVCSPPPALLFPPESHPCSQVTFPSPKWSYLLLLLSQPPCSHAGSSCSAVSRAISLCSTSFWLSPGRKKAERSQGNTDWVPHRAGQGGSLETHLSSLFPLLLGIFSPPSSQLKVTSVLLLCCQLLQQEGEPWWILMDKAQHGAEEPCACTQLEPESISALKSYCSQHFQRLESTSTYTHTGNLVCGFDSQTLFAEEHLPHNSPFLFKPFPQVIMKKSCFSAFPIYIGSLLCKMTDPLWNVLVALLYITS